MSGEGRRRRMRICSYIFYLQKWIDSIEEDKQEEEGKKKDKDEEE